MYSSYLDIANRCALQTLNYFVSQGGINCSCGAIDQASRSSKDIKKRVIINFRDKNAVIARFRDKSVVIARFRDKNVVITRFRDKKNA